MNRFFLVLSIGVLSACAEREKQPEQAPPAQAPAPVVAPKTPISKFKGLEVKKPIVNNVAAANNDPVPAPAASAAADAK
jgi:hypothetical protein